MTSIFLRASYNEWNGLHCRYLTALRVPHSVIHGLAFDAPRIITGWDIELNHTNAFSYDYVCSRANPLAFFSSSNITPQERQARRPYPHITTDCAGECVPFNSVATFKTQCSKGPKVWTGYFQHPYCSAALFPIWLTAQFERWNKGFTSPLDDLPITTGPTAVVKRWACVCVCACVCVHRLLRLQRLESRLSWVVMFRRRVGSSSALCCFHFVECTCQT